MISDASHGGTKRIVQIDFWNAGSVEVVGAGGTIQALPSWITLFHERLALG
jgi:hypothetical protein